MDWVLDDIKGLFCWVQYIEKKFFLEISSLAWVEYYITYYVPRILQYKTSEL